VNGTGIKGNILSRPLATLLDKRVITSVLPLSEATSDARRYYIADPYLRFWLRFIEPRRGEIDRGIGATNAASIAAAFGDYAGRAIEPIVRTAIERMIAAGDRRFGGARIVGGYWTKDNKVEIDLVGADRETPPVKSVSFVGTVKWRAGKALDGHDVADLERSSRALRGVTEKTLVVAVSRTGFGHIAREIVSVSSDEILAAFDDTRADGTIAEVREGVREVRAARTDLLFVTLEKSDRDFSPTTRYADYPISPSLFQWESQSTTSVESPTGSRYINHADRGSKVVLFVRERKEATNGVTLPYVCLGFVGYASHERDRPIRILWKIERPMPSDLFETAKVAAG